MYTQNVSNEELSGVSKRGGVESSSSTSSGSLEAVEGQLNEPDWSEGEGTQGSSGEKGPMSTDSLIALILAVLEKAKKGLLKKMWDELNPSRHIRPDIPLDVIKDGRVSDDVIAPPVDGNGKPNPADIQDGMMDDMTFPTGDEGSSRGSMIDPDDLHDPIRPPKITIPKEKDPYANAPLNHDGEISPDEQAWFTDQFQQIESVENASIGVASESRQVFR